MNKVLSLSVLLLVGAAHAAVPKAVVDGLNFVDDKIDWVLGNNTALRAGTLQFLSPLLARLGLGAANVAGVTRLNNVEPRNLSLVVGAGLNALDAVRRGEVRLSKNPVDVDALKARVAGMVVGRAAHGYAANDLRTALAEFKAAALSAARQVN